MNQVLHILKKDMRCFRVEIVLVFVSAVLSVRNAISERGISPLAFSALFWIAGTLLISRVIHAEAIPGDKLYWLTRPYRWKSLLAEKLLFLFLFVGLPPVIVIFVSLEGAGFSLGTFLPSLLFRELLIFLVWIIPVAALAAVTESLSAFLVGLLFVGAFGTTLSGVLCCLPTQVFPNGIVWVPGSLAALILVWGAVAILYIQYRQRWTVLGRVCAAVTVILCIATAIFTPFALGVEVQSVFSRAGIDPSSMVVSLENDQFWRDYGRGFLLDLKGVPPGLDAHAGALVAEVVSNDGKAVNVSMRDGVPTRAAPAGTSRIHAYISEGDIARLRGKPVTVRGSVYVTLFSAPRSWQQNASERFETAVDGVRCGNTGNGSYFTCRAMSGSPRGRLSIQPVGTLPVLGIGSGSYWPFPALWLSPYEELSFAWLSQPRTVEFRYTEAVSHFWLNFDIPVEHFLE